jgi:hypothetical protein
VLQWPDNDVVRSPVLLSDIAPKPVASVLKHREDVVHWRAIEARVLLWKAPRGGASWPDRSQPIPGCRRGLGPRL